MTYEQDKELRRLTRKAAVLSGLMENADFARRCEMEVELEDVERRMNRLYDQTKGAKNEVQS